VRVVIITSRTAWNPAIAAGHLDPERR
jgi:hypothetical protein